MHAFSHRALRGLLAAALVLAFVLPVLAACGKRPSDLKPLPPADSGEYPRKYPRE
jgi:hypothetical protein